MAYRMFSVACCCNYLCYPKLDINLYNLYDLSSLGNGYNINITLNPFTGFLGENLSIYQWPSGHDLSYLNLIPLSGYSNPQLMTDYQNNTVVQISGYVVSSLRFNSPLNTGDCRCGPYYPVGGIGNTGCFGYEQTNVKEYFNIQAYDPTITIGGLPTSGACTPYYQVCDLDVCDTSGHQPVNIPYCPTRVHVNLDSAILACSNASSWPFAISTGFHTEPCPSGRSAPCLAGGTPSVGYDFYYLPLMHVQGVKPNEYLVPNDLNTPNLILGPAFISYIFPTNPILLFDHDPVFDLSCTPQPLWLCNCVQIAASLCQEVSTTYSCNNLGIKEWTGLQMCSAGSDCCGGTVYKPGIYPSGPLNFSFTAPGDVLPPPFYAGCAPPTTTWTGNASLAGGCFSYGGCLPVSAAGCNAPGSVAISVSVPSQNTTGNGCLGTVSLGPVYCDSNCQIEMFTGGGTSNCERDAGIGPPYCFFCGTTVLNPTYTWAVDLCSDVITFSDSCGNSAHV